MEFIILNSDNIKGLSDTVNVYIANGWEPAGGVTFCRMNHPHMALIRKVKEEKINDNASRTKKSSKL